MSMKVTVYSDGSSRGNPGPGGFGTVMHFVDANGRLHVKELSAGYRLTTNNRMELMGAIAGLEARKRPCVVEMWTDSQYVVNAFNKNWIAGWLKRGWGFPVRRLSPALKSAQRPSGGRRHRAGPWSAPAAAPPETRRKAGTPLFPAARPRRRTRCRRRYG